MGLSWNPEPAENILMEAKTIHTYVHTALQCQGLYTSTNSKRVLNLMVIFSAGQAHEVLRTRTGNTTTFQRCILVACNAQTPF